MPKLTWVNPAGLARRTGGTLYNARVVDGLRRRGWRVEVLQASHGPVPSQGLTVVDGLVFLDVLVEGTTVALVHSPLHRERGGDWRERERRALARADHVAATSQLSLDDLGVQGLVFAPGTDPAPTSTGDGVLCVAHLIPRKGHRLLLDALDLLQNPPRVRCVGALDADPAHARSLTEDPRVDWLGELQDLEAEYARAGLLVHCAEFEAWSMVLDEALARGLAVVTTEAGALERCRAQVRVISRDPRALADALQDWSHPERRPPMRPTAALIPTWDEVCDRWSQWLSEVASRG